MTPAYSQQGAAVGAADAANNAMQGFSYHSVPGLNPSPVTQAIVHGQALPLSADAIQYYQKIGVDVSPANNATVAANNPANATSPLEQANALGYSLGSSGGNQGSSQTGPSSQLSVKSRNR